MKNTFLFLLLVIQATIYAQFPGLAQTPPMGWNSWNAFGLDINSEIVKAVADSMVSKGLANAGYQYIVIDDGWQIDRDKNGKIIADSTRFPEGIKYLADYVHSKGLKFGIYTCCGTKTCGGRPGSYGYEAIDARTYAEWGVDFIKEDWCFTDGLDTRTQYKIMSDAIKSTGRPMLLSLCEWGVSNPWQWGEGIGSMWRTTNDIQDCFDCIRNWGGMGWVQILDLNAGLAPFSGPGHWNDPDMLEVGNKSLTLVESRAHFAMWCMLAAPLIAGNNISTMNNDIRDILTASEIIAIDQDPLGAQGTRVRNENGLQVWQKPLQDGSIAVALLNVTDADANMHVTLEEIGLKKGVLSSVRDLWKKKDLESITEEFTSTVKAHGIVVVKIKGEKASASKLEFAESSLKINKGNYQSIHVNVYPATEAVSVSSSDPEILAPSFTGVNTYLLSALKVGDAVLRAQTEDGMLSASCDVHVLPPTIQAPWKFNDVRNCKASVNYEDGIYTIESYGLDIWGASDQFAFLNQQVDKDSYISSCIISQSNSHPWAKTGVMIRESSESNSAFVMLCVTPGNGISLQWREATGGSCNKKDFGEVELPVYLKLEKNSSTFNTYKSTDGSNWMLLDNLTMNKDFQKQYLIGVEVVSHTSHTINISKFSKIKIEPVVTK